MLGDHAGADRLLDHRRLLRRARRDGVRPRRAAGDLPPGRRVLRARGGPVRRPVADHPHHERRAAGADARADDLHAARRRPRSCRSAASSSRCRQDVGAVLDPRRRGAGAAARRRSASSPRMVPQFRGCRCGSTRSTGCCASSSPASASSAPSCASRSRRSGSRTRTPPSPRPRCGPGGWFALMFPFVMLVLNVSSVAVIWFGAFRIDDGTLQIGALTAFLSYLVQILMAVMMATFMAVILPRAAVSRRPHRRGARHRVVRRAARPTRRPPRPPHGTVELRRRDVLLPGRRAAGAAGRRPSPRGRARPRRSSAAPAPARPRWSTCCRASSTSTGGAVLVDGVDVRELDPELLWSRIGLVPQRAYLFSGTVATNLRYGNPDATDDELWTALEIAQARRLRAGDAGGARRADRAGRHERLRRPAATARDRQGAGEAAADLRLRRLVLGARHRHGCAAARRARPRRRATRPASSSPSGSPRSSTPTRSSCSRTAGSSATGTHDELLETCPSTPEIVASQLAIEEASA